MDGFDTFLNGITDIVNDGLEAILNATIYKLFYYVGNGLCKIVGWLDQMFRIFAGINKVTYDGEQDYLINIFFNNSVISNIYWGMALIGIVLCLGFAAAAVVRKAFDMSGRQQQGLGQIITSMIRSIVLILGMSAVMIMVLNATNVLMQQVNYLFSDAANIDQPPTIYYTNEEYAAMGRVLNTIGNYAVNPSFNNRYNINTCFNEIRTDLYYLQRQGVFRYHYPTRDANGRPIHSWQSVLQQIANSADLRYNLSLDAPNESVRVALLSAVDAMRNDTSMAPLKSYTRVVPTETLVPLDRTIFLMGTLSAAQNSSYNIEPSLDDSLRSPYYTGEKNVYNLDSFNEDFDISIRSMDYIIIYVAAVAAIVDLLTIILNCVARIFNMLFLYLIAPPIIAVQPFDNGGKTKQWMTAFLVQSLSVFGTVIAMRLLLVYLPIVVSPKLVLFADNSTLNWVAKLVLIFGGFEAAKKSTALLTGILADSAGWQSVQAGDMSGVAQGIAGRVTGAAKGAVSKVGGTALKGAGKAASFATKPLTNVAKRPFAALGRAWSSAGSGDEQHKVKETAKMNLAVEKETNRLRQQESGKQGGAGGGLPTSSADSGKSSGGGGGLSQSSADSGKSSGGAGPTASPPPLPSKFESSRTGVSTTGSAGGASTVDFSGSRPTLGGPGGLPGRTPREAPQPGRRPTLGDEPPIPPKAKPPQ